MSYTTISTSTPETIKPIVERDVEIGAIKIHLKSVFSGQITLHKAYENIILRKREPAIKQ